LYYFTSWQVIVDRFSKLTVAEGLKMSFKTSRQYIEKLVQAGILREITGYARNQIYRADEVFSALDSLPD